MTATRVPTTWTITLPHFYSARKPLTFTHTAKGNLTLTLTGNSRHNRWGRHSVVKRIRETTAQWLILKQIPPQEFVTAIVELHHPEPGVKYLRDRDNLWAMAKPMFDAMQPGRPARAEWRTDKKTGERSLKTVGPVPGAGIIPDDSDKYARKGVEIVRGSSFATYPVIVMRIDGLA